METRTVLLISNRRLEENAGRAEKFATRARLLEEHGWNLRVGYVEPTATRLPAGTLRCIRLARSADVINSVSNPPHLQIAGGLAALMTGTPWLAEFRDPLVENPDIDADSLSARVRRQLERYILARADRVVWYDGIQLPDDYFATEYPDVPPERYQQLPPIGFEREKFAAIDPASFDEFTITYAGSFYEGWIEPYDFLNGLKRYATICPSTDRLQALFYGDWDDAYETAVAQAGLEEYVEPRSFVPHTEIVGVLKGSDALLYIGGDDPDNRRNLPSKLYDYIGARTPIIAIVDPSFRVADVIRQHGFGIVVEPGNPEGVSEAIANIWSGEFEYVPDTESFDEFTRKRSTEVYVEMINQLAGTKRKS